MLVSCSGAIPLKRIELIIEGLANVRLRQNQRIRWVHIGDGESWDDLRQLADRKLGNKESVEYCFMGQMPNESVLEYYRQQYVGCFITTTETEGGAPVAVQEVLSFGVPVIATRVGELPLMVQNNGIIVSERADGAEVGEAIDQMMSLYGTENYWDMCRNALSKFDLFFNAERNFPKIVEDISEL